MKKHDDALLIQLGSVLEAGGAVQTVIGQTLRWGLGAVNPQGESNQVALLRDLDDLKAAIKRVEKALKPADAPGQLERLTQATEQAVAADLAAANIELGPAAELPPDGR